MAPSSGPADSGGPAAAAARWFVAVRPTPKARLVLERGRRQLRARCPAVPWLPLDKLHVTVAFFGAVAAGAQPGLRHALRSLRLQPLDLGLASPGRFPARGRARVVWVGLHGDLPALHAMAGAIRATATDFGVPIDPRPLHPHLTLARLRKSAPTAEHAVAAIDWQTQPEPVDELELLASTPTPTGAAYQPLEHLPLPR